jgi:predicted phosphodiesterase
MEEPMRLSRLIWCVLLVASISGCARPVGAPDTPEVASSPASQTATPSTVVTATPAPVAPVSFAVIGDYGMDDRNSRAVARLVKSWDPDFVITTGDDYYSKAGGTGTGRYDESTGAHYGVWLADISTTGERQPSGEASVNAFFPALGNHDYSDATPSPTTYLKYFKLPGDGFTNTSGNERYYDYVQGPVHFFALNSCDQEPDGTSKSSDQAEWLKAQLTASDSEWNVVYDHHPPYSSDSRHGSSAYMRWPFAEWGADVVLSGHSHTYERIERNGIVYFVNGLGGAPRYRFGDPVSGSKKRYRSGWGAQRVWAAPDRLVLGFYNVDGELVDRYELRADGLTAE